MKIKHLIILSTLALSGCSNLTTLSEVKLFCASGYVDSLKQGDKDSCQDIKCKREIFVNLRDFQP